MDSRTRNLHKYVVAMMKDIRGDDLERAERAFRGLTAEQMMLQHGSSGRSRQQILDDYRADRELHDAATAWLEALPL